MRNLVTGDYGAKTQKRSGYKKYKNKRSEGDTWEEDGKKWIFKSGVKQSVVKLKSARDHNKIPFNCPKCDVKMAKGQHKLMYKHYGHCLICQTKAEAKMRAEGVYDKWVSENIEKNFGTWKQNKRDQFDRWFSGLESKHHITEAGEVEDWTSLDHETKEMIITRFESHILEEEEKMKKYFVKELKLKEK